MGSTFIVGTTPVLLSAGSKGRGSWSVSFLSTAIVAGNTGLIFVGRGFQPTPTLGAPSSGDVLQSGGQVGQTTSYYGDTSIWKGDIWVVASIAAQQIVFEESYFSAVQVPVAPQIAPEQV